MLLHGIVLTSVDGMKITVAIATTGRPDIAGHALRDLARQTRLPDRIVISAAVPGDIGETEIAPVRPEVLYGKRGLTVQRNAILDALRDEDIVLFLDDDFVMDAVYLAGLEDLFRARPDICIVTGNVLADGIGNAGLTLAQALRILDAHPARPGGRGGALVPVNNGYGCNMAFRCAPIRAHGIRFDENLPLYGWLEDVDFSRRVAAHGGCVRAMALHGVHLGAKGGRTSGLRLGYSQVANPVYLFRRETMRRGHALRMICRNIAANAAKSLRPEPWVDRRGRLRGNLLALADLVRGRIDPGRILTLGSGPDARARPPHA